ncbi:uncharacterized protein TNCV_5011201 [Trichonephila clavipes]|nr:uncharacterized protein TNCV_5011201 [Trichonephila clavipes]
MNSLPIVATTTVKEFSNLENVIFMVDCLCHSQRIIVIVNPALARKKKTALRVKRFYQNGSSHLAALREYLRVKDLRKGPISKIGFWKVIMKFEERGDLGVLPGRGPTTVGTETAEEVSSAVVEKVSSSIYSSASGPSVSCELEIPWLTVRKILRYILKCYPYKIQVMQMLKP